MIWFGCTSNWLASSESVRSPRTAARATFAFNSAEWLRRGRLLISRSCLPEHYHALNQAAIPLIPLFRFPEPLLITHRLDYLQVFYYPSGATKEMGPTDIVPGTHMSAARGAMLGRIKSLKISKLMTSPPGSIFLTVYSILHRRSNSTYPGVRDNLKYNYWRTTEPRRDWAFDPDFNFSWLSIKARPMFGADQAKMFAWLCGEEWEHMGGQAWPSFTATVQGNDQMGLPTGLRRDG